MSTDTKVIGGIAVLTIVILAGGVFFLSKSNESTVPTDQVVANNGLHWHPELTVTIEGKKQEIPPNLGMAGQIHLELHTHNEDAKDGVVHMEMKGVVTKDKTKLGNFFRIWGKEFTKDKIFDKTNNAEKKVKMTVNGKENTEFEDYLMKDGDNIEIRYE